jgi:transcriptional regulator with XRE-family HTH domain
MYFYVTPKIVRILPQFADKDITQKEMALILNCSQQVYSNYELGQRDIPTDILIRLAKFHKVSTDYILGLSETRNSCK